MANFFGTLVGLTEGKSKDLLDHFWIIWERVWLKKGYYLGNLPKRIGVLGWKLSFNNLKGDSLVQACVWLNEESFTQFKWV